jgi:hypothetical protein
MNSVWARPAWMISRAIVCASAMSVPTFRPSQRSANRAVSERRGSTTYRRAPLFTAVSTWWKKMGCALRAFEPHITITSAA